MGSRSIPLPTNGITGILLTLTTTTLGACDQQASVGATGEVTPAEWELAPQPVFKGSGFRWGQDSDSVFFVRVHTAILEDDGDVVVALADERLLFLDSLGMGVHVTRVGEGPGEFNSIVELWWKDENVIVWDKLNSRLTYFSDGDGDRVETRRLEVPFRHEMVGVLPNGTAVTTPARSLPALDSMPEGVRRHYVLRNEEGVEAELHGLVEMPRAFLSLDRPGDPARRSRFESARYHLGNCLPDLHHAVIGDRIVIADSESGELVALNRSDSLTTLHTTEDRPRVTEEAVGSVDRWIENVRNSYGAWSTSSQDRARERIGRAGDPLPTVWSDMLVDSEGNIWLERPSCFEEREEVEWEIINSEGYELGSIRIPAEFRVLAASANRVLVVERDALGVEYLILFTIRKAPSITN